MRANIRNIAQSNSGTGRIAVGQRSSGKPNVSGQPEQTPKVPHPVTEPDRHIMHGFLGPQETAYNPKRHLNRFIRFYTTHCRDQYTDSDTFKDTDRATYL